VGSVVTGVGTGFAIFGGILSSLGLEEAGDAFSKIGGGIMIAGSAISAIIPMISALKTAFVGLNLSLGPILLVLAGVAVAIAAIAAVAIHLVNTSPEKKLEKAQQAADDAAMAAE
jgi:methionine synthase I (cobalamin-dependent)